ncbi:RnfABCDGE type electron transport complex subunit D [Spirulina major CS-329]|uniref:RnfABCDGE type electron transport complex subunit D n=1 Tax=Spirulina TaxID=1154 RepID=UPI00232BEC92|nr:MULTISPECIES: RnfABCDGE type electron transport complex subunit D [Spirulina]MDB9497048.1 RnfABCDGE type electron transport complex subunit D [Spirulina subsalsa CS-330]MDB9501664.1 RnfABCDGE type electron transport complex subunit D [Spirulina major CS-329]
MLKDARIAQISFLALFLLLGISTRDWTLRPELLAVLGASCLGMQWVTRSLLPTLRHQPGVKLWAIPSWESALITGLGLCLLLRGNTVATMALAGGAAIASKTLFQYRDKHFFNPANFGIIVALLLTPDAWVSPGQWGTQAWYLMLFVGAGGLVLRWVGRWETSAVFLATYAGLEAVRMFALGWTADVYLHKLMSGSLLLFALFMVTDPRSIPNARQGRFVWAAAVAWLAFLLQEEFFVSTAMFWALFALSPLTPVLDRVWPSARFQWQEPESCATAPSLIHGLGSLE